MTPSHENRPDRVPPRLVYKSMRSLLACLLASTTLFACEFSTTRHPGESLPVTTPAPRPSPPSGGFPKAPEPSPPAEPETTSSASIHEALAAGPEPGLDWSRLIGDWYATNERTGDGTRTYVRHDPGPSRFRQHFVFERSGRVQFKMLASNDGHYTLDGTWTRKGKRIVIRADRDGEQVTRLFDVLSLSADSMRLRLIPFQG